MAIGEALIMVKEISDIISNVKAVVEFADQVMTSAQDVIHTLLEASRGAMVETLNKLWERLKSIFAKFIAGIRNLCDVILKAMDKNEITDKQGADALSGVIT